MSRGKHSAKQKHFDASAIKFVFKILIFFILVVAVYFVYDIYLKDLPIFSNLDLSFNKNTEVYEPTEKVEIKTTLTVNGAEYLEITGVYINSDNPELSTVAARLKNNSDQSYENVNIRINLFDKDNNEITFLDYKIDKIEANGQASTFAALQKDLSNCVNYSIVLIK